MTDITANFPEFGDSIDSSATFMLGIHSNTQQVPVAIRFQLPPPVTPLNIDSFLVGYFNKAPWVVSWAKDSPLFTDDTNHFRAVVPTQVGKNFSLCLYHLAKNNDNSNIMCGTGVCHTDGLAPPLAEKNNNVFHRSFGILLNGSCQHIGAALPWLMSIILGSDQVFLVN